MPYLVIIDATGGKTGSTPAHIVYRKAGFDGAARLRQVIDTIGGKKTDSVSSAVPGRAVDKPGLKQTAPGNHASGAPPMPVASFPSAAVPSPPARVPENQPGPSSTPAAATAPALSSTVVGASGSLPELVMPARQRATHTATLDFSTLWASDVLLTDELIEYRSTQADSELAVAVSHGYIGLRYAPESRIETGNDVANDHFGF